MFVKSNWVTRVAEFMGRRKLTTVGTGEPQIIIADVERYEGGVTEEGTPFSSGTMNDLENRIENAFNDDALRFAEIENNIAGLPDLTAQVGTHETSINNLMAAEAETAAQAEINRQKIASLIFTQKFNANVTVSAGAIGERGGQVTIDASLGGYKVIGVFIDFISNSTKANIMVFKSQVNDSFYINAYRVSTAAQSVDVEITVTYLKE